MHRLTRSSVLAALLLIGVVLSGCGDDKDTSNAAIDESGIFKVTATDYRHSGPKAVKAGHMKIQFTNAGKTFHQVTLARIKDASSRRDLVASANADLGGALAITHLDLAGGINGLTPGATQTGEVDLTPGRWVMTCFIPGTKNQNHAAKGMVTPFTVTGPASSTASPTSGTPVALRDMSFTIPAIKAQQTTLRVSNEGPQPHEIAIYRVLPGKTGADVVAFLNDALSSRASSYATPPFALAGGVPGLQKGRTGAVVIDFQSGTYIAACLIPDPTARKPHVALGMLQTFTVP
jgi:hypothetical protein